MVLSQMVVLEVYEDGLAAVLDKKGTVRMIPDKNYREGQVLHIDPESIRLPKKSTFDSFAKKLMPIAACFAMAVVGILGGTAYAKPVSKLNIKSGAGMEYDVNFFDRVIKVNPTDEKGKEIFEEVTAEVRGKTVKEAVPITLTYLSDHDYIPAEGTGSIFTVDASDGKTQNLEAQVKESVSQWENVNNNNEGGNADGSLEGISDDGALIQNFTGEDGTVSTDNTDIPAPAVVIDQNKPKDDKTEDPASPENPTEPEEDGAGEDVDGAKEGSDPSEGDELTEESDKQPEISKQNKPHNDLPAEDTEEKEGEDISSKSVEEIFEEDLTDGTEMSDNIEE